MHLKEKRAHQRVDVSLQVQVLTTDGYQNAKLVNLSKGGAGLSCPPGTELPEKLTTIAIPLPGDITLSVQCSVKRKVKSNDGCFYGLKFNELEKIHQEHLLSLIETIVTHASSNERRKATRVARRIPIKYKHLHELEAVLENISLGGLSMIVETPHIVYDAIEVTIPDLNGREFLILKGKLLHQTTFIQGGQSFYKLGIEFTELTDIEKACLKGLIMHILNLKKEELR